MTRTETTSRKQSPITMVFAIILFLIPFLFCCAGYIAGVRADIYHEAHQSEIISIPAVVTNWERDSDDDRYVYVTYTHAGQAFNDIRWQQDTDGEYSIGDAVTVQIYPNGEIIGNSNRIASILSAILLTPILCLGVAAVLSMSQKEWVISQARVLQDLHNKTFSAASGPMIMGIGTSLILTHFLMSWGEAMLLWGMGILALGLLCTLFGLRKTLKTGQLHYRWATGICSHCEDHGDSDTSDWRSSFENMDGLYQLGKLDVGKSYWLLLNERNDPELAYAKDKWKLSREHDEDSIGLFIKQFLVRILLCLASIVLVQLVLYYIAAQTSFLPWLQ